MKMRGDQVFVQVSFDFDYISEDGKHVHMKENEILLLINKTNHDWWQVIRRGDRRPFYAPARYVVELRPEEIELASSTAEVASRHRILHELGGLGATNPLHHQQPLHYPHRPQHHRSSGRVGSPADSMMPHPLLMQMMPNHVGGTNSHHHPHPHPASQHPQLFSTFQANRVPPLSSKRSSYSPKDYTTASSGGGVSNSVEHLFLFDGHSTTSSTGSRRSIASNGHRLRSYPQQAPNPGTSGGRTAAHGSLYENPLDKRSPTSPTHMMYNAPSTKIRSNGFKERYRSNSLDSILVADLNHKVFSASNGGKENGILGEETDSSSEKPFHSPHTHLSNEIPQFSNVRHSTTIFHLHPPQHHLIPKHLPGSDNNGSDIIDGGSNGAGDKSAGYVDKIANIQKRPTFDSLDKRKSWSVDINTNTAGFARQISEQSCQESPISSASLHHMVPGNKNVNQNVPSSTKNTFSPQKNSPKNSKENNERFGSKGKKKSNMFKETTTTPKKPTTNADKQAKSSRKVSNSSSATRTPSKFSDKNDSVLEHTVSKDIKDISGVPNSSNFTNSRAKQATADTTTLDKKQCNKNALTENTQNSVKTNNLSPSDTMSSLSAYQNTQGIRLDSSYSVVSNLNKSTSNLNNSVNSDINNAVSSSLNNYNEGSNNTIDYRKKKPVPLPRSKIPLPSQQQLELEKAKESKPKPIQRTSVASRLFWKRSKTDLGLDAVTSYKNNKQNKKEANVPSAIKYPAPKVPTFNRPIPNSSELPVVIDVPNVKRRSSTITTDRKAREARQRLHLTSNTALRSGNANQKGNGQSASIDGESQSKPKPEIKEKPTFSTFKQQTSSNASLNHVPKSESKGSKHSSIFGSPRKTSTLTKKLVHSSQSKNKESSSNSLVEDLKKQELIKRLHENDSGKDLTLRNNNISTGSNRQINHNKTDQTSNELELSNSNRVLDNLINNSNKGDMLSSTDNENLLNDTASNENKFDEQSRLRPQQQKSAPLMISTEPLVSTYNNDNNNSFEDNIDNRYHVNTDNQQERMSESADKSCSTSFDSMEDHSVVQGSRTLSNSSNSSVLSSALANAKNEMNILKAHLETSGSESSVCKVPLDEKSIDNRLDISKDYDHHIDDRTATLDFKESDDNSEFISPTKQKEKIFEETMEDDNICTSPEPVSNATLFMSDSSLQLKSPISTTSRSPPSPTIGATPTRQVMPDWDEFVDNNSGRKYYYNTITKEKSWKPPRKTRGPMNEGGSLTNASPDQFENNEDSLVEDKIRVKKQFSFNDESGDNPMNDNFSNDQTYQVDDNIPHGYEQKNDPESGRSYYMNMFTGVRWFSATDKQNGKTYFYEENGNESCWTLPNVSQSIQDPPESSDSSVSFIKAASQENDDTYDGDMGNVHVRKRTATAGAVVLRKDLANSGATNEKSNSKFGITKTSALQERRTKSIQSPLPVSTPDIRIGSVNIVVNKQGPLHKTKWLENGKKHRKNWTNSHVVLTDTFILFFKDAKSFQTMSQKALSHQAKPDLCIDLKGATIDWSPQHSKRNNVFEVSTLLGTTVLLQDDSVHIAGEWFQEINKIIDAINQKTMPPTPNLAAMNLSGNSVSEDDTEHVENHPGDGDLMQGVPSGHSTLQLPASKKEKDKSKSVNRTKSLKMKLFEGSNSELKASGEQGNRSSIDEGTQISQPASPNSATIKDTGSSHNIQFQQNRNNIREMLRKLFQRRPTMEDLFGRGIIKNEPVFGSTLRELQATELSDVPLFVKKCISQIESGELLKTDGVYRQSGNLSTIQKIRLQVDQGNLNCLETVDDVHVLTGALKLFFRELKEPLIPWGIVDKLLLAANSQSRKQKVKQMKALVQSMSSAHRSTLGFLLRHLVKVTEFKDRNRMQFSNLAIVFGPTLMWPPTHLVSNNLALDMMQQNIIVEALLNNVNQLFG